MAEQMPLWGEPDQPATQDERVPQRSARWSGPLAGQTALPPHGTDMASMLASGEGGALGTDAHGNYNEYGGVHPWDPMGDIEAAYSASATLRDHASRQPVQMMRTDTPVHTMQDVGETEDLYDAVHGSEHRQNLDADIAARGVKQPIPIVHHQGRHIVLDGHHRLLAARKAGFSHVPVQVFDHDAHVARGGENMIEGGMGSMGSDLGLNSGETWSDW